MPRPLVQKTVTCAVTAFVCITIFGTGAVSAAGRKFYAAPNYVPGGGPGSPLSNGLTRQTPFLISDFWDVEPAAGDILVLLDGEYRGADSMLITPADLDMIGTPTNWIRIVAEHDGQVLINGDDNGDGIADRQTLLITTYPSDPIDSNSDGKWDRTSTKQYISIEGINICNSTTSVINIKLTNHVRMYRVCAWNAPSSANVGIFTVNYSDHALFEDCAGWGTGRKIFVPFGHSAPGVPAHDNTFRRCFGRWEYSTRTDPKMTFSIQYGTSNTLIENCIGTWDERPGVPSAGITGIFSYDTSYHGENRWLGCIAFLKASQSTSLVQLFHAGILERYEIENCYSFVDTTHPRAHLIYPFYVTGIEHGNVIRNVTALGGKGIQFSSTYGSIENALVCHALDRDTNGNPIDDNNVTAITSSGGASHVYYFDNDENWESRNCSNFAYAIHSPDAPLTGDPNCPNRVPDQYQTGPSAMGMSPALNLYGRSFVSAHQSPRLRGMGVAGDDIGANIWHRYVDGVLTDEPLWPWPMNRRILDAMTDYYNEDPANRPPPINVTQEVFELNGGSMPGDYNGDGEFTNTDVAIFMNCFRGPGGQPPANCETFDFDQDHDVDLADYARFQRFATEVK